MTLRIGVLGGGGFIGEHVVRHFAYAGFPMLAATRRPLGWSYPGVEQVVSMFESWQDFDSVLARCDVVIHCATRTTPSSSDAQPQLEGNLRTTLALIEAMQRRTGVRLIYMSSGGTLYGECVKPPDELAPLRPRSYHGAGKAAAEHFIGAWADQFQGRAVVLRPSNVYGPGQVPKAGFGLISTAFDHIIRGEPMTVWGDGSSTRDYLYVEDLIDLISRTLATGQPPGVEVFNASGEVGVSVNAVLDAVEHIAGRQLIRRYMPQRRADLHNIVPTSEKARRELGWLASTAMEEGLHKTWQWFISQG